MPTGKKSLYAFVVHHFNVNYRCAGGRSALACLRHGGRPPPLDPRRLVLAPRIAVAAVARRPRPRDDALTLYTFGDSILDYGRYNRYGVHPGQLIARDDDKLFPEFKGRDRHGSSIGQSTERPSAPCPSRRAGSRRPVDRSRC